ncbi:MAG: hydroxyacid dehydrogenase [bacterium]
MKVVICDPVDDSVNDYFENSDKFTLVEAFELPELENEISDASFLIIRSGTTVTRELMEKGEQLLGVVRAGVGLDNVDLEAAEELGVEIQNTPEASTNAVAELVVAHILAIFRTLPRADAAMKQGEWIKKQVAGCEIMNKTVGLVGYGRIGQRTGELLAGFGAKIIAYDEYVDDNVIKENGAQPVDLESIITDSDIISLHVPLTAETKDLFSTPEFKKMKESAIIVNCSRGGIINEDALNEALSNGDIYGAGLDTYTEEPPGELAVLSNSKLVATPHLGATTSEAQARIARLIIDKIEAMA